MDLRALLGMVVFATSVIAAPLPSEMSSLKTSDTTWAERYHQRSTHVGKAVCSCLFQLQQHPSSNDNLSQMDACIIAGVLENTVSCAHYERIDDSTLINSICTASWVSIMQGFHPSGLDTQKLCQCATPTLSVLVNAYDKTTPQELRNQALSLVKQCSPNNSAAITLPPTTMPISHRGVFILDIQNDKDPDHNNIAHYLREHDELRKIVAALNQNINIPYDIHITVTTTGMGPYYEDNKKTITLDYQMLQIILDLYDESHAKMKHTEENRWHYFNNVVRFLLYHELGHALISAYHLPVLGQEEDAADALGAIIALNYVKRGYHTLLDSADFFSVLDKYEKKDNHAYWNEHALSKQRYFRLLCYAYGRYPQEVEGKLKEYYHHELDEFIKERRDYCVDEYHQTYGDWMDLLKPYLINRVP